MIKNVLKNTLSNLNIIKCAKKYRGKNQSAIKLTGLLISLLIGKFAYATESLENDKSLQADCPAASVSWIHNNAFSPFTPKYSCVGNTPQLKDGEEAIIYADPNLYPNTHQGTGFVKVKCIQSYPQFENPSFTNGGGDANWNEYLVKVFKKEPLDFSCANEELSFSNPRIAEDCRTSSSKTCFESRGGTPTSVMACWNFNIYLYESIGLSTTAVARGQTLGQHFGTNYQVFVSSSKDGFSKVEDITHLIKGGYGQFPDSKNPTQKNYGFSLVTRKDMENTRIQITLKAKTSNGQERISSNFIDVKANPNCQSSYDGRGTANIVMGKSSLDQKYNIQRGSPFAFPLK